MSRYRGLAGWYDALTRDVPYGAFVEFYRTLFRRYGKSPETVLDLACGTGTLTLELARRGYELIAVDGSEEMLAQAYAKTAGEELPVRPMFLCQKMEELDLYGTVQAAICSLDGFNYLPPDGLAETLRRLRLFIEPGGLLIFDVNTPEKLRSLDGQVFLDEGEDFFCVWRASLERSGALVYGLDLFTRSGRLWRRDQEEHVEYVHTRAFLEQTLREQGFGDVQVFGELRETEPEENEQRIFVAALRL